jgi:hypothetical protein
VVRWLDEARDLANEATQVELVLANLEQSRRLNPRALGTTPTTPGLRSGPNALEHAAVALRALYRSLADRARHRPPDEPLNGTETGGVFADLLRDLATAIRDFGALIRAEPVEESDPQSETLSRSTPPARHGRS